MVLTTWIGISASGWYHLDEENVFHLEPNLGKGLRTQCHLVKEKILTGLVLKAAYEMRGEF